MPSEQDLTVKGLDPKFDAPQFDPSQRTRDYRMPNNQEDLNDPAGRCFPIMLLHDPWNELPPQIKAIPWELIAPHEKQAQRNHCQSLEHLASRGGLSACEAVAVLEDADYRTRWPNQLASAKQLEAHETEAINRLRELCSSEPANADISDRR